MARLSLCLRFAQLRPFDKLFSLAYFRNAVLYGLRLIQPHTGGTHGF